MSTVLNLSRGNVDRDEITRNNPELLEELRGSEASRFLLVSGASVVTRGEAGVQTFRRDALPVPHADAVYLGRAGERAFFALDVTGNDDILETYDFGAVRLIAHMWPDLDTALAVEAVAVLQWHRDSRFCGKCGGELSSMPGGWERRCADGHPTFPRQDPAVIMAIRDPQDRLLLAHNARWSTNRYSVLAGFVEAGEPIESAVVREVMEETSIVVDRLEYVASQPWPFPRSLMFAFEGWTSMSEEDIRVDGVEMEYAHFFDREEFKEALRTGDVIMPTPTSVAAVLIERWLGEPTEGLGKLWSDGASR